MVDGFRSRVPTVFKGRNPFRQCSSESSAQANSGAGISPSEKSRGPRLAQTNCWLRTKAATKAATKAKQRASMLKLSNIDQQLTPEPGVK